MDKKLKHMVLTALFTSLCCVATMIIRIPSPMQGYVNLGDCIILLSAWLLGPLSGTFVGGVGSMLADLLAGYAIYAPGTLVIKGLTGLVAALLFRSLHSLFHAKKKEKSEGSNLSFKHKVPSLLLSAVSGEAVMVAGYFLYARLILSGDLFAALSGIPGNLFQALIGIAASILLYPILVKSGVSGK